MSIFASRVTKTIPIPFDPPHEVTIKKLAGRHLGKAHDVWMGELYLGIRDRGGAAAQKEVQALFAPDKSKEEQIPAAQEAIKKVQADPLNGYDPYTIVKYGVTAWTYPDVPFTPEAVEDLDDEAVTFFAREIMRLTKPGLFQTAEEAEVATKNG